ncbi:MAG: DNA-binding response regulator [Bacteroidetes bacterium]|nr:MAG: DNA-binding response regulator [Bacteroidota bacterium]
MPSRILIIEDEPRMQEGLKDNLEFEGYEVDVAGDGRSGLERLLAAPYDLVLLDVMLPHLSGLDVCRQARARGATMPIIMLTARGEEIDKVLGLELGADDYVTKPFSLRELLARVKAVLRRAPAGEPAPDTPPAPRRLGRLSVSFDRYQATCDGEPVAMTHLEFEVLRYLVERPHQTISRDRLLSDVWGYDAQPTTRTVDNFILKLRQKIEDDSAHPRHILTVHGVGYKFVP